MHAANWAPFPTVRREGVGMGSKSEFANHFNLLNKKFLVVSLLLLICCGTPVLRYDSALHLALSEVRAKHSVKTLQT